MIAVRQTSALICLTLSISFSTNAIRAQTLDSLRESVRKSDSKKDKAKEPEKKEHHPKLHWSNPPYSTGAYFAGVNGPLVTQNYLGGYTPLPTGQRPLVPQAEPDPPQITIATTESTESYYLQPEAVEKSTLPGLSRLSIEGGTNFKRLSRIGIRGRLEREGPLGLEASGFRFYEHRKSGGTDSLGLGDVNLTGRLISDSVMRVRAGGGANWLSDNVETNFGINLTASAELFITDSLYGEFEFDGGKLGSAQLLHMRVQTGYVWRMAELFIGYDHYSIGSAKLHGLVSGIGIRF